MEQAKNHEPRACAHDGCRAFTYLTYFRANDEGNVYQPRAACSMVHVLPDGTSDPVFPLPLCCLDGCDNEIAAGDCPDHGAPKAACTKPHFALHHGAASKRPRRATKRAPAKVAASQPAPSAALPGVPSTAASVDPLGGRNSSLFSPVAHTTKSRPVTSHRCFATKLWPRGEVLTRPSSPTVNTPSAPTATWPTLSLTPRMATIPNAPSRRPHAARGSPGNGAPPPPDESFLQDLVSEEEDEGGKQEEEGEDNTPPYYRRTPYPTKCRR
jgi:hypothetical protein